MKRLFHHATTLLAAMIVGLVVGWLIGESGGDAAVLAAAIPVLLSGAGMVLFYKFSQLEAHGLGIILNVAMAVFFLSIYSGTQIGIGSRKEAQIEKRIEHLERCVILEYRHNTVRKQLGLEPLKPREICP